MSQSASTWSSRGLLGPLASRVLNDRWLCEWNGLAKIWDNRMGDWAADCSGSSK